MWMTSARYIIQQIHTKTQQGKAMSKTVSELFLLLEVFLNLRLFSWK